jgi:hypothetical protein
MKKELIKIGIGLLFLFGGWKIAERGDQIVSKETIQELQNLCENSIITKGKLKDSYKEITVKIGKIKTKMYEFSYDFSVEGNNYSATITSNLTTAKDSADIWYRKSNPAKNSTNNPCVELEKTKKEKTIGNSGVYYIGGILLLLIGVGLVWSSIKQIFRNLLGSKKK